MFHAWLNQSHPRNEPHRQLHVGRGGVGSASGAFFVHDEICGHEIGTRRKHLPELYERRTEFFERHASLLGSLRLPHDAGGPAVSLVERQVLVLRQKNVKLERKLNDFLAVARSNDALATRIHALAMLMLAAPDQAGVVQVLEEQLRISFNADQSVLVVFEEPAGSSVAGRFLRVVGRDV